MPCAPAALRNSQPIFEVISDELKDCRSVLEIGSGTGQHAVFFASRMPSLIWQTSDLRENHGGINRWIQEAEVDNVIAPLELDVEKSFNTDDIFDAVFSANTAHIMSIGAVACMFRIAGNCLVEGGKFCLYGPFNLDGGFTSDSNRNFDASLKSQNREMGIRDLAILDGFAEAVGMLRTNLYAMPANNMLAVWNNDQKFSPENCE